MSVQSIAQTITLWAAELEQIVPMIDTTIGVNATITNEIATGLDDLKQSAAALANAEGTSAQQPALQRVQADWQGVSGALMTASLPTSVQMIVNLASMIIPMVIGLAGTFLAPPPRPAPVPAAA